MSTTGNIFNQEKLVLKKPRITEKATYLSGNKYPVYTFEVPVWAGKIEIKKAFEKDFKVKPLKVRIINLPSKVVTFRRQKGVRSGVKKAMIYLPVGQTIDVV